LKHGRIRFGTKPTECASSPSSTRCRRPRHVRHWFAT
jgi:hypothetical protein